jgi:hypothetical protein
MYMRVTKGRVKPGCWDKYEAAYLEHVEGKHVEGQHVAGHRSPAGLLGRWLMRSMLDRELAFSLSLWETREAMEAYERSDAVRREILPHLAPFISNDFAAFHCGVTVQAMRPAGPQDHVQASSTVPFNPLT